MMPGHNSHAILKLRGNVLSIQLLAAMPLNSLSSGQSMAFVGLHQGGKARLDKSISSRLVNTTPW